MSKEAREIFNTMCEKLNKIKHLYHYTNQEMADKIGISVDCVKRFRAFTFRDINLTTYIKVNTFIEQHRYDTE